MSETNGLLLIVDMAALAFRSHFALINRPLKRKDGMVTSALYGTCGSLLNVLEEYRPTHVICAMDTGKPTFRHEMYDAYKANRPECPPDLRPQLEKIGDLSEAFSLRFICRDGFEADDVIAHYTRQGRKADLDVLIYSGDKDFMQLLDDRTKMLLSHRGGESETLDKSGVVKKLGVEAEQVADYLALVGDSSDNVPGAPGVGKVTASKLLGEYGDLDTILDSAPSMTKKGLSVKLTDNRELIELSRQLVDLSNDLPEAVPLETCLYSGMKLPTLIPFLEEMEFPSLVAKVKKLQTGDAGEVEQESRKINIRGPLSLELWTSEVREGESGSLLFGKSSEGWIVAWSSNEGDAQWFEITSEKIGAFLVELSKRKVITTQLKELSILAIGEMAPAPKGDDLLLMSSVFRQGGKLDSIQALSEELLYHSFQDLGKVGNRKKTFVDLELKDQGRYLAERVEILHPLHEKLKSGLEAQGTYHVYEGLELPLQGVIAGMESKGVGFDERVLQELDVKMTEELKGLTTQIHEMAGEEFNIASPKQLGVILFEKLKLHETLKLKKVKKTKTGFSTDSSVLESLGDHPLGTALLRYRFLSKLQSTYIQPLPTQVREDSGKIHTTYHQNGTATGRLSSQEPNLQNIPMREPEGAEIRKAFVPSKSSQLLIAADYSQIELRVLAHFCKDEVLAEAFKSGADIHTETAARVFKIDTPEVSRQQRSSAKAVNFGLLYGMGPKLLSQQTGLSFSEAQKFIRTYFETFPRINSFMLEQVEKARTQGYADTIAGRRRYLPDLDSDNGMRRNAAENMALNTPIQGSAADIIKWAMIALQNRIDREDLPMQLLLQVHDELVLECEQDQLEACIEILKEAMESTESFPTSFTIPLKVDVGYGKHWLDAHN